MFKNDKIDFILVSGDNSSKSYNEPKTFKRELIKRGIPENVIFLEIGGRSIKRVVTSTGPGTQFDPSDGGNKSAPAIYIYIRLELTWKKMVKGRKSACVGPGMLFERVGLRATAFGMKTNYQV